MKLAVDRTYWFLSTGLPNSLLSQVLATAAGLLGGIALARSLGPELRGEFAIIILWPTMLSIAGELGLSFAFAYYAGQERANMGALWNGALLVSLVVGGFFALAGAWAVPTLIPGLSEGTVAGLQLTFAAIPFMNGAGYQSYLLLGAGHLSASNLIRLYLALSYSLGIVLMAALGMASLQNLSILFLISQASGCGVATLLVVRHLRPQWDFQPRLFPGLLRYGMKAYFSSIAGQANLRLDQLVMTSLVAPVQLGYYVVAVAIGSTVTPLFSALAITVLPRTIQAGNRLAGGRQAVRYFQLGLAFGLPVIAMGILAIPWAIEKFFGAAYLPAAAPAQLLMVASLFQGQNAVMGNGLRGLGHPGKSTFAEGVGLLVTMFLLVALLPVFGIMGAAVASLCAYAFVTAAQLYFIARIAGFGLGDFLTVRLNHSVKGSWLGGWRL